MSRPMSRLHRLFVSVLLLSTVGCASSSKADVPPPEDATQAFVTCPKKRPTACTLEYFPVCATRDTGVRCIRAPCPSSEQVTRANACTACADDAVSGYTTGACAEADD